MVWTLPVALFVCLALWMRKYGEEGEMFPAGGVTGTLAVALVVALVVAAGICTGNAIGAQEDVQRLREDIALLAERYESQRAVVLDMMQKYPLEPEAYRQLEPALLLKLPEIQSDKLLVESVKLLVNLHGDVVNRKCLLNETRKRVRIYRKWLFVPTLYRPAVSQ